MGPMILSRARIAKFMTKNYEELTELLNKKVKNISGVKGTRVLLIA